LVTRPFILAGPRNDIVAGGHFALKNLQHRLVSQRVYESSKDPIHSIVVYDIKRICILIIAMLGGCPRKKAKMFIRRNGACQSLECNGGPTTLQKFMRA